MDQAIVIKSNKYGLTINLNPKYTFAELKKNIIEKFTESKKFFKNQEFAISFTGKALSDSEKMILVEEIVKNAEIKVPCIIDDDIEKENLMKKALESKNEKDKMPSPADGECKFYKGTLRSGQLLESETSVVILGDVNPGAKVVTKGNIIVLGVLKGSVCVGANGNKNAFVVALTMDPMQIQIADYIARSEDAGKNKRKPNEKPMIAYVDNNSIYIEQITKEVIAEIKI